MMVKTSPSDTSTSSPLLTLVAEYFKVLSELSRLTVLELLKKSGPMNVTEIAEATGLGQANLSKHLKVLTQAGLLNHNPSGVSVYYEIADPTIFELCDLVRDRVQNRLLQQAQQFDRYSLYE